MNFGNMIGFTRLGSYGRLGNQLFQIAFVVAHALKMKTVARFPLWKYSEYFTFNQRYGFTKPFTFTQYEKEFHFHKIPLVDDADYVGYFQSEKYFKDCVAEIKTLFFFRPEFLKRIRTQQLDKYKGKKLCAIHVRRGDYVGNSNYYQVTKQYYIAAITKYIPKDTICIFFSDDIAWCKTEFGTNFEYCDGLNEIETLAMMSQCDHFIISNSTFSWWGAWLGEKKGSIIVTPHRWNDGELLKTSDDKDIVPERWIRFNPLEESFTRTDLLDVTFTIPIRIDHQDRSENIQANIAFLNKYFNTNILVYECDRYPHFSSGPGYEYNFIKSSNFHRTFLLNKMARASKTPYIVNWDADVFIDPKQILKCINTLRNGKAAGCYPYDGRFLRIDRKHFNCFRQCLNVEFFRGLKVSGMKDVSYGGAVAWNKNEFLKGGGENENFIDYGPEDYERYHRFTKLGYTIERIKGPLFHINHNIHSQNHSHRAANTREYERIEAMDRSALRKEVDSWA